MTQPLPPLTLLETRVLGTLVEKQRTVPDTYPLSVNALQAGCNQKTSRNPVIDASESDIVQAIDVLKGLWLVNEISGSRVSRYEHRLEKILAIPSQASALLTVLMLRGPQTAGELRLNCDRLHKFADISSVEAFLEELASREAGALVVELPRLPGSRENRWAHLLSGAPDIEAASPVRSTHTASHEIEDLKARVAALEAELADMRTRLTAIGA